MKRPILEGVAQSLVRSGVAVLRFDWAYFVKDPEKGRQSESRADEVEDMQAVLDHARAQAWADKAQVFVGGKSLGSIIAWRVLRGDPTIAGAVLLTPVCSRAAEPRLVPETNYPDIASERRPIQWIFGDRDPVCDPRALYQHVARAPTSERISLLAGDHSFVATGAPEKEPSRSTRRTIQLASDLAAEFVATAAASAHPGTTTR
jgi:dienelactone hydrolase